MTERELFIAALRLPDENSRAAYLEGACSDQRLRERVESMLRDHEQLGSFLEVPASPPAATADYQQVSEGPGTVIGPYKLLEQIGEGGMGVVFMAEQTRPMRRKVALKIIKPGMDTKQVIARFEAERQALALMDHPNIARVLDAGSTESGRPYFVMELVRGIPITDYCDREKLSISYRLELFVLVCQAVQHAHQKGIIHRDLKPSNVLITLHDGVPVPKVIDFGIAKATGQQLTEKTLFTGFAQLVGTPLYMSPEQAEMSGLDIDTRSDLYSLGVLLYELLTGTTPFDREAFRKAAYDEIRRIIREQEPPRPSTRLSTLGAALTTVSGNRGSDPRKLTQSVRGELDWVVMKCLEKDRTRRYETASGLAADVRRYLADEPVAACPPSAWYRFGKLARRQRAALVTAALVFAALAVGLAGSTAQWVRADRHAAREAALRADLARELYNSDMLAVQQAWEAGNVERMEKSLRRHIPEPGQPDWRGFEWYVFWRNHQRSRPIRTFPVSDTAWLVAATPNGRTLATLVYVHAPNPADERIDITLWDAATGWKPRTFRGTPETFGHAIALSPDGSTFATGHCGDVKEGQPHLITLWDAATGTLRRKGPDGHGAKVTMGALAFSPDGKKLLWGDEDTTISFWDLETGEVRTFKGHKGFHTGVEFDPKGRWIASASWEGTVRLWDLVSRREVHTFPNLGYTTNVAFSPDGRYLAAGTDSGARMWDLTRPEDPREIELKGQRDTQAFGNRLSFSPDGRYLTSGSANTVRLWEVESGEARATLRGHSLLVFGTAFLDGGRMLASGGEDRTVKLWDVAQALGERDVLTAHSGSVESLAFTPDGQTLVSGGRDGWIRRWEVAAGRPLAPLGVPEDNRPVSSLAISPDGRTLADPRVGLWDLKTARLLKTESEESTSLSVAFSPVEPIVAMVHPGTIRLWDAVTGKLLRPLKIPLQHDVDSLAFSPDGRILASAGEEQKVTLWEVDTGRELASNLVGHASAIQSLAFSADGRALASGSRDGTVILWDIADPAHASLRRKLEANAGAVWAVAYSPDGRSIASGNDDGTVKLWDPVTGRERCTLVGHSGRVRTLAFSRDGSVLATGDAGGTIRLWRR